MQKQNGREKAPNKKHVYSSSPQWVTDRPLEQIRGRPKKEYRSPSLCREPALGEKLLSGITNRSKDPNKPSYRCQVMKDGVMQRQAQIRTYDQATFIREQMLEGTWTPPEEKGGVWLWGKATREYFDLLRAQRKKKMDDAGLKDDESLRRTTRFNWHEIFCREYIGETASVDDITEVTLERYKAWAVREKNWAASTINSNMAYLMQTCRYAYEQGHRTMPAPEARWVPRKPQGRTRVFNPDEEALVKEYFTSHGYHRTKDFFDFALRTGIRPLESFKLLWKHIDFKNRRIQIEACHSKTGKERFVPMLGPVHDILANLRYDHLSKQPDDLVDDTAQVWSKVKYFSRRSVTRQMEACRKHLGLERDHEFCWYACRHTCTSRLLADGVSPTQVMAWMGWSSMSTLNNYLHHLTPEWDAAVKKAEAGEKIRQETKHRYYDVQLDRNNDDTINYPEYNLISADAHPELLEN